MLNSKLTTACTIIITLALAATVTMQVIEGFTLALF